MSDLLLLAGELRNLTDAQLVSLIDRRPTPGTPSDFLDLAQALLQPKSIVEALCRLTAAEAAELLEPGKSQVQTNALVELGLVVRGSSGPIVLAAVREQLAMFAPKVVADGGSKPQETDLPATSGMSTAISRPPISAASITLFETAQAITEIILDFEQRPIKVVGRGGIGIADVKRLCEHLNQPKERVKLWLDWVTGMRFVAPSNQLWWLTPAAESWMSLDLADRFAQLANHWRALLGKAGSEQLSLAISASPDMSLPVALRQVFPLAGQLLDSHLDRLERLASDAGLSIGGLITDLLPPVLADDLAGARKLIETNAPGTKDALIVQADLSIIAPGPLTTATEVALRRFANIESVGVASSYRLSPSSLSLALELGQTLDTIRGLLTNLSGKPLPQPVDYLLREAEQRFARLQVWPKTSEAGSTLRSTDNLLLTEILNDTRLRPFGFWASNAASLASRFDQEVLYHGLRDYGYVAVMVDSEGKVLAPRHHRGWAEPVTNAKTDAKLALVQSLREADSKAGAEPGTSDLQRQLLLAIKTKSELNVVFTGRDGGVVEFRLLPTSLANGRLRGLDKKADAERTLPIERVVRIEY